MTTPGTAASPAAPDVLTARRLGRATLARQLLLRRADLPVLDAVEHLVGLQAQAPTPPYYALAARLAGFRPEALSEALASRRAVRISVMRSTIHLVGARDCRVLRPWTQPVHDRGLRHSFGKRLAGVDLERLAARARALVEERPLTFAELGEALRVEWPDHDRQALAMAARTVLPLVQVTPRGLWGRSGAVAHTTAGAWLGEEAGAGPAPDPETVLARYLAAFGPASVKDMGIWCGLTRLRETVDRMAPRLRTFRDEHGTVLYDLPDMPLPEEDTAAPPRFLPDFDNLLLSHADRRRVVPEAYRGRTWKGNYAYRTFLVDGFLRGLWRIDREPGGGRGAGTGRGPAAGRSGAGRDRGGRSGADAGRTTLVIEPFAPLGRAERAAVEEEGAALLAWSAPGADHDIRIAAGAVSGA